MQFSKPAGLRLTDISQESGVNVVYLGPRISGDKARV